MQRQIKSGRFAMVAALMFAALAIALAVIQKVTFTALTTKQTFVAIGQEIAALVAFAVFMKALGVMSSGYLAALSGQPIPNAPADMPEFALIGTPDNPLTVAVTRVENRMIRERFEAQTPI